MEDELKDSFAVLRMVSVQHKEGMSCLQLLSNYDLVGDVCWVVEIGFGQGLYGKLLQCKEFVDRSEAEVFFKQVIADAKAEPENDNWR